MVEFQGSSNASLGFGRTWVGAPYTRIAYLPRNCRIGSLVGDL